MADNIDVGMLDSDEVDLILRRREKQATLNKIRAFRLHALETAGAYERWLQENRRADNYSVFVNGFGYKAENGLQVFTIVKSIRAAAIQFLEKGAS